MIIDSTYFVRELSLPNIVSNSLESGVSAALQTVGENSLDLFIEKYEEEYLIKLLGKELANKFMLEVNNSAPDDIWKELLSVLADSEKKTSPIANYIYYWIMRDSRTSTTMGGECASTFDKAQRASQDKKLVKAWNDSVNMTIQVVCWINRNESKLAPYGGDYSQADVFQLTEPINSFNI